MTGRSIALVACVWCSVLLAPFVVGCGDGDQVAATITAADTADQVLFQMVHHVTVEGIQRATVKADTAFFYSLPQLAELRHVTITFYDVTGAETSTMRAREGTYRWRTGDMEGRGDVRVVTTDGRTLTSSVMRYFRDRNEVSSDRDFVFDGPGRHIEGEGFTSDPTFRNVVAKRPRGTGGQFTLPNQ